MFKLFLIISLAIVISDVVLIAAALVLGTSKKFLHWYTRRVMDATKELQSELIGEYELTENRTKTTDDEEA